MNEINPVQAFETSDGTVFTSRTDAIRHQAKLNLAERLVENPLWGNRDGAKVEADDLVEWLIANADVVREIVK